MKILMLVNWKIEYCEKRPMDKQPPDYYVYGEDYWFYRYFKEKPEVDVIDIRSLPCIENFEKNKLRFYVLQALRAIPKLKNYDLIVSHGMQSGVVISLWRRFFKGKEKHVVFDIGSFASASESGFALKLMQYASKSIDALIYHTSSQIEYYKSYFPWIVDKSKFVRFGTDHKFFDVNEVVDAEDKDKYIICVGYSKRDWETVIKAYQMVNTDIKLRLVGHVEAKYNGIEGVEQIPFMPIKELMNQIHNAAFCVLPLKSFNYSYGQMTLMQQMALGKAVITADVPSLRDYVYNNRTALLYEPRNAKHLAQTMEYLLNEKAIRRRIGEDALFFLKNELNEVVMAKEIEKVMQEIRREKTNRYHIE